MNINIGKLVVKGVHTPNVDGYPLYTPVENYDREIQNKSAKWVKMANTHFNSPTNVRNVAITNKKVVVELYKGIYENGKLTKKTLTKKMDSLDDYARCLCQSEPMAKLEYKATGTGLKSLVTPWVTTNIETLYFDWTCLLDQDIVSLIGYQKVQAVLAKQATLNQQDVISLFCNETKCTPEGISEKFPRLNKIGFAFDLEQCLDGDAINQNAVNQLQAQGQMTLVKIKTARRSKFGIRSGIYKYDDLVLNKYVKEFTEQPSQKTKQENTKADEPKEEQQTSQPQQQAPQRPTVKSEEEKLLLSIYSKTGYDGLKKALKMCDNLDSLLDSLTQEGYELCSKALNR